MCAGVSFKLAKGKKSTSKKEEPIDKSLFQSEDSEEEETSVIEHVEEYGGSPRVSKAEEKSSSLDDVDGNDMACSLSQVLRRRKRTAVESSEELFRIEVESAAPETCKEDYDRVPVESFGKYMLSKMGWKGEEYRQVEPWQNKTRPPRLGLGAKVPHNPSK